MDDRPYIEMFCLVEFENDNIQIMECDEIDHPIYAEVVIPVHTDTAIYALTCYLTNRLHDEPALVEMLALKPLAPHIIKDLEEQHDADLA